MTQEMPDTPDADDLESGPAQPQAELDVDVVDALESFMPLKQNPSILRGHTLAYRRKMCCLRSPVRTTR